jgi:hypothetical protein
MSSRTRQTTPKTPLRQSECNRSARNGRYPPMIYTEEEGAIPTISRIYYHVWTEKYEFCPIRRRGNSENSLRRIDPWGKSRRPLISWITREGYHGAIPSRTTDWPRESPWYAEIREVSDTRLYRRKYPREVPQLLITEPESQWNMAQRGLSSTDSYRRRSCPWYHEGKTYTRGRGLSRALVPVILWRCDTLLYGSPRSGC